MLPEDRIKELAQRLVAVGGGNAEQRAQAILREALTESDLYLYREMIQGGWIAASSL